MFHAAAMGYRPPRTLNDLVRLGYWLQVDCSCGHVAKLDPEPLRDQLHRMGHSLVLDQAMRRLKCSACGKSEPHWLLATGPEIWS